MDAVFSMNDLHQIQEVTVGDTRQWFEKHPTVQDLFPRDLDTELTTKIMTFMGWLAIFLEDEKGDKDLVILCLAKQQQCSAAVAWYWLHTEDVTASEVLHFITQAAEVFHKDAGFCCVYHPSICKNHIRTIEMGLRMSFRDLQVPRQMSLLQSRIQEEVPPATVPDDNDILPSDTSDEETIDGNTSE